MHEHDQALAVTLKLVNTGASCACLEGYAIHLWHCTCDGGYSPYSNGVTDQNFLCGGQVADANGEVGFTTVFPGCYSGRWPHMHFEIYPSLASDDIFSDDGAALQRATVSGDVTGGFAASLTVGIAA